LSTDSLAETPAVVSEKMVTAIAVIRLGGEAGRLMLRSYTVAVMISPVIYRNLDGWAVGSGMPQEDDAPHAGA
jgi:ABC-type phosphate transport system permease subunit